jgi:hypothetical protein
MAYFYANPYEQPLIAARQELEQRLREAQMIQQRIEWLRNSIAALEPLANANSEPPQYGTLADLLCAVLSANPGRPMTLAEIRRVIDAKGVKFQKPSNAAAAVNVTLRRLAVKPDNGVKIIYGSEVNPNGGPPIIHGPMQFFWDPSVPRPSPQIAFPAEK